MSFSRRESPRYSLEKKGKLHFVHTGGSRYGPYKHKSSAVRKGNRYT